MELRARNVQAAYVLGLQLVRDHGVREDTRNGPALVVPWPVMTVYERPLERVLLDPSRDANPFFHLMESIWMLAGRRDVESLSPYNAGLKTYSDDGKNYHGAYGHRWRRHFYTTHDCAEWPLDQLARVIELLRQNPSDRRVVLSMWDPTTDLGQDGADFPCNTQIYFRTREDVPAGRVLDMTVMCRSNDAIWGAYGANAVHFSVLQEFVAALTGSRVGIMYQLSNNLHAYEDALEKVGTPILSHARTDYERHVPGSSVLMQTTATPLFQSCPDMPVAHALRCVEDMWAGLMEDEFTERLFTPEGIGTIVFMRTIYHSFKKKDRERALGLARDIPGPDWRRACVEWLERRYAGS